MADSHDLGQKGEALAAEYLEKAGYRILQRNFKWGSNEIDIIAENDNFIVFTEVKTRRADFQVSPSSAVNREKQKSIILAADGYLKRFGIDKESRFDVITVVKSSNSFDIDHIENAFYPTLKKY